MGWPVRPEGQHTNPTSVANVEGAAEQARNLFSESRRQELIDAVAPR